MPWIGAHVRPSADDVHTMSLLVQPARKRQSYHETYTVPAASTAADGFDRVRKPAVNVCFWIVVIVTGSLHEAPPSVERYTTRSLRLFWVARTTTVPFG